MDSTDKDKKPDSLEGESLDAPSTGGGENKTDKQDVEVKVADVNHARGGIGAKVRNIITHMNIYLLMFIVIVVLSIGLVLVAIQSNKKSANPTTVTPKPLSTEELDQISSTDATVGDPKQTLTIESNSIFSGKVLIKDSLDVAGTIKVGGALSLPGISVSGTSNFDQIQANSLSIAGNTSIQGQLTIQESLTTSSGATFGGPISAPAIITSSLQLANDLQITRHIDAGGPTPGKSDGTALGYGGTSSISGTDIAGTVTINTGGSPGTGCFATITFAQRYGSTPHIAITPVGSAGGGLSYYINRSTTSFSICTTNPAPAGQTFSFDYVIID
ncbi:hypothetical protein CR970_03285 [Candidatus Saccharibacteria bacterium]|nr:MAG: hypothetical protein CR970_03285 [Candidatus Saccharibacteria bacterium]